MKKSLFVSAMALVLAFAMNSCKNDPASKLDSLSIRPATVTLAEGATVRLSVVTDPADLNGLKFEWSSDNERVATVDTIGVVTAIASGTATITVKSGEHTATCAVTVSSYLETLEFNSAFVYNFEVNDSTVHEIEASTGEKFKAYKADVHFEAFSAGFYVNGEGYLDGAQEGAILEFDAPMYYATKELNGTSQGTIFCLGAWGVVDNYAEIESHAGQPGNIAAAKYVADAQAALTLYNNGDSGWGDALVAAGEDNIIGARLTLLYYDVDDDDPSQGGYYYVQMVNTIPNAIAKRVYINLTNGQAESDYMIAADYCRASVLELQGEWWGLDAAYDTVPEKPQFVFNSNDLLLSDTIVIENGTAPADDETRKFVAIPAKLEDRADIVARHKEQMQNLKFKVKK